VLMAGVANLISDKDIGLQFFLGTIMECVRGQTSRSR
jgi:hypothetical protein